jgi:hypothetical protein
MTWSWALFVIPSEAWNDKGFQQGGVPYTSG